MKPFRSQIFLVSFFVVLSVVFYFLHYSIFRDSHHIFIYLLGDIAFVPIEVLLVTLIIHRLLSMREKRALLEKLNMIIGSFFTEVGTRLLTYFSDFDSKLDSIKRDLVVKDDWTGEEFATVSKRLRELPDTDLEHLAGDIKRAYSLLVHQWLDYMKHLKDHYPYLFSLAMRTNPFDEKASPIVR